MADLSQPLSNQPKLGIIAGGGNLPKQVIRACRDSGRSFYIIAITGQTDKDTADGLPHDWVQPGAVGKAIKFLKQNDVRDLIMVGYYQRPAWNELRPDLIGAKWLAKFITKIGKDDGILRLVVREFELEGFNVVGVKSVLGDDGMAPEGSLGKNIPSQEDWISINRGFEVLTALGKVDIGQSVIVQEGTVVGVEAMEGTDQLILRCQGLHPAGKGGVLIKMAKPYQDMRVDTPVIGPKTIETAIKAGLKGIAVQSGQVIILDPEKVIQLANKAGLFLVGCPVAVSG